ncbi:MAG TPA: hypothetical protein PKC70_08255 [Cellvibrionaceae bacterium]|nr:hypothetical protein [Cellvibrionaceae bacterium]HNG60423.1 hypothetical protein [Cellvibrionaceae bacterium]
MRKKNLKFTASIAPSRLYLLSVLALHTLASVLSLCIDFSVAQHLFALAAIAASLCYQLGVYAQNACWVHVSFEADQAICTKSKINYFPIGDDALALSNFIGDTEEYRAELLPKAWVLPHLVILYVQFKAGSCKSLIIVKDSIAADDFRRLKIFVLNGPLLKNQRLKQGENSV